MQTIQNCLAQCGIEAYRIVREVIYSKEWFFIRKQCDMSRAKEVTYTHLTIYSTIEENDQLYTGSASRTISGNVQVSELKTLLEEMKEEAKLAKNEYYDLPLPEEYEAPEPSLLGHINQIFEMMNDFHETEEVWVNSYELFESIHEIEILNSNGVHVNYAYPSHELELVLNGKNDVHEIETYHDFRFGYINITELKHQLGEAKRQTLDRLVATKVERLPENLPVIISKQNTVAVFAYYLNQCNAQYKYSGILKHEIGDTIAPEFLSISSLAVLENSSKNRVYDEEGRPVLSLPLIKEGKLQNYYGSSRFAQYLGLEKTTQVYNFKVSAGTLSLEEMKKGPYLEVVSLSSFFVHPLTGGFAGEIRLAYYHDGETTTIISGGSISGNMRDNQDFICSTEREKYDGVIVPAAIQFNHVSIAY